VRIHIKEQPAVFDRFGVQWTPTVVIDDSEGTERHRFQGFLPVDDFLAQLELGLAHAAFARKDWGGAEERYRNILKDYSKTEAAPEALYWAGVAKYKASGDAASLKDTAEKFKKKYSKSTWAKKSSVWAA
jgi:TolA-binding protein